MHWLTNILRIFVLSFWARVYGMVYRVAYMPLRGRKPGLSSLRPSWAAAVGCLTCLVLSALVLGLFFWLAVWRDSLTVDVGRTLQTWWTLGLLVLGISLLAYIFVKLIPPSQVTFDDIDAAWHAGLSELAKQGIQLQDVPLFLVLGVDGSQQIKPLFRASRIEFAVQHIPAGANALHWYANHDAVFLVCSQVGCLTHVARDAARKLLETRSAAAFDAMERKPIDMGLTAWPEDDLGQESPSPGLQSTPSSAPQGLGDHAMVTAVVEAGMDEEMPTANRRDSAGLDLDLNRETRELESRRLRYLARLLSEARRPYAPVNGVVTLLPHNMVLSDNSKGAVVREAVDTDLTSMVQTLQLRFPTWAVVTGWEGDRGFHELVRRLGPDIPQTKRFGKGSPLWAPPYSDRLEAVCHHACGAFEDFIYHLFKQPDATKFTTNRLLYDLLCKIRRYLSPRLVYLIPDAYGCTEGQGEVNDKPLFGGCYFVAAGSQADNQAFVPATFHRFLESQQELEWTPAALRQDAWHWRVAGLGCATTLVLALASIVALYWGLRFH